MTDLNMPYLDGINLAKKLREFELKIKAKSSNIPNIKFYIALATAEEDIQAENKYLFNEILIKPVKTTHIKSILKSIIEINKLN